MVEDARYKSPTAKHEQTGVRPKKVAPGRAGEKNVRKDDRGVNGAHELSGTMIEAFTVGSRTALTRPPLANSAGSGKSVGLLTRDALPSL